jgi:hypothetical protein
MDHMIREAVKIELHPSNMMPMMADPRAGLDVTIKRKILPCEESSPSTPACSLVTVLTAMQALVFAKPNLAGRS